MRYKIAEITIINGSNLSKAENWGYINYLDTANLNENVINELHYLNITEDKIPSRAKRKIKENDILISTVRPNQKHYGIIKKPRDNMVASTGFTVLTAKGEKVDPEYLYRFLTQENTTTYLQAIAETSTSTYPSITSNVIGNLEIDLPPLEEQKAIAHILSTLDEKIEVNNQINKTLEEMAQTIFKHWFVDFEFPNENGEPYKSSGGEMIESELGMIPRGWEVKSLDQIVDSVSVKHKFSNGKIIFLNTSDIYNGEILNYDYTDITNLPGQAKKSIQQNDILYSEIRPQNRRFAFVDFNASDFVVSTKLMVLRSKLINPSIPYFLLTRESTINELQTMAESRSGTFPQITFGNLKYIKIAIPSYNDKILNYDMLSSILYSILNLYKENKGLVKLRDTLLPKLMSGEIRVPLDQEGEVS